ncbi:MAG: NUDIX hydrolase [Flavobacteriales bacterium]
MYELFTQYNSISIKNFDSLDKNDKHREKLQYETESGENILLDLLTKRVNEKLLLTVSNSEKFWNKIQDATINLTAAGGAVKNNYNQLLFIYRRGKWDLPKGKAEEGESIKETAKREVEEECGIEGINVKKHLCDTYHIYQMKNELVLKKTVWYNMGCPYDNPELTPQEEEDITDIKWFSLNELNKPFNNTFPMIKKVAESAYHE